MMKKLIVSGIIGLLVACNSGNTKSANESTSVSAVDSSKTKEVTYAYPITYSSQFEMANPENSKLVLDLWKDYDNNTLDKSTDKLADSVTLMLPGMTLHGTRDSIIAALKAYRNSFSTANSTVHALMSTKSTDKNEDWVLVWGTEVHTDKKNVTDSVHLQETWRINKNGKADLVMQYMRQPEKSK